MRTDNLRQARAQGASTVAGAVILGTLPSGLIALFTHDPATAVMLSIGWAYVNFTQP